MPNSVGYETVGTEREKIEKLQKRPTTHQSEEERKGKQLQGGWGKGVDGKRGRG